MKITEHFYLAEFAQPARHGFPALPYPEEWIEERLHPLCLALEVIRDACGGHPLRILSGYRAPLYNAKIGGARDSQHVHGRAADFFVQGVAPFSAHATTLRLYSTGRIKIGGLGSYPGFTHVDIRLGPRLARWGGDRTAAQTEGLG